MKHFPIKEIHRLQWTSSISEKYSSIKSRNEEYDFLKEPNITIVKLFQYVKICRRSIPKMITYQHQHQHSVIEFPCENK